MNESFGRTVTVADADEMIRLIRGAVRRLVVLAPGLPMEVAQELAERWRQMPERVTVVLDAGENIFRLGYGDIRAVRLLKEVAGAIGRTLDHHAGIRIGVIVSDESTLIWSPTPRLVEEAPTQRNQRPNALRLDGPLEAVASELGAGDEGLKDRTIGLECLGSQDLHHLETRLKENPPQRFDLSRRVLLFNSFFQFVDLEVTGVQVARHTVSVPSDLLGVVDPATQKQLRTSFRLMPADDELSGKRFMDDRALIAREFLKQIPGHGAVILRTRKPDFEKRVEILTNAVEQFRKTLTDNIQARIDGQRDELVKGLLPAVLANPPARYTQSAFHSRGDAEVEWRLRDDLNKAFRRAALLIQAMRVRVVYKDVTYECLTDEDFMAKVREAFPQLEHHFELQEATPVQMQPA